MQAKLGRNFRVQSYRALIDAPESQMKEILDFIGLPWEEAVLRPESSPVAIRTASVAQVREGVNRNGIDRWQNYEAYLQPLIHALGGWEWIHNWEERDRALWR